MREKGIDIFLIFLNFYENVKIMQCMKFLDQNNECMQECYECQDEHQEHYEDHDEHQEHIFKKFLMPRKHARHQT